MPEAQENEEKRNLEEQWEDRYRKQREEQRQQRKKEQIKLQKTDLKKIQRALIGFIIGIFMGPFIVMIFDSITNILTDRNLISNIYTFSSFVGGISGATLGIYDPNKENPNALTGIGGFWGAIGGAISGAIYYIFIGVANPTAVYSPLGVLMFFGGIIGLMVGFGIGILFSSRAH